MAQLDPLGRFMLMGILFVIAFFAASSWALVSLIRRLRREQVSASWWLAFVGLAAVGIALGVWCALHFEYRVGARYRVGSFPLPVVLFHWEDGQWVDFPVPEIQAWAAAVTNVITITALATLPFWVLSWRHHRHEHTAA